jgi:hypothetical protein
VALDKNVRAPEKPQMRTVTYSVILPRLGPDVTEAFILAHPGIGPTRSSQRTRQGKQHPVET